MGEVETPQESGRRGGIASGETKRRERADPLSRVRRKLPEFLKELTDAALGEGKWKELPVTLRLQALQRCIEYGVGRPVALDRNTAVRAEADSGEGGQKEEPAGLTFE